MADTKSHVPTSEPPADGVSTDHRITALRHRLRLLALLAGVLSLALLLVGSAFIWRGARGESLHRRRAASATPQAYCTVPGCSDEAASTARFDAFRAALGREGKTVLPWTSRHCEPHSPYVCAHCTRRESSRPEACASCGNLIFDIQCESAPPRFTPNPANHSPE